MVVIGILVHVPYCSFSCADVQTFAALREHEMFCIEYAITYGKIHGRQGFQNAIELFKQSDAEALATLVSEMDTEPREQIVVAFNQDCGSVFVKEILGYEVYA